MKNEQIKKRKEKLFKIIKEANEELEALRKECKHEKWFRARYEWAPGHGYDNQKICEYCGEALFEEGVDYWTTKSGTFEIKE